MTFETPTWIQDKFKNSVVSNFPSEECSEEDQNNFFDHPIDLNDKIIISQIVDFSSSLISQKIKFEFSLIEI